MYAVIALAIVVHAASGAETPTCAPAMIVEFAGPHARTETMPKKADRNAPPRVEPAELNGTRFEQVLNARRLGLSGDTGYLRAVEIASGRELWITRVYEQTFDPTKEQDVQLRFFTKMEPAPDGSRLLITNEAGEVWSVDPATGASDPVR